MMFSKKILLASAICSVSTLSYADTTYLFCASRDGSQWDWVYEPLTGEAWVLTGRWESDINPYEPSDHKWFGYFVVDHQQWLKVARECDYFYHENGEYHDWDPHPADSASSNWYLLMDESTGELSEGYYTKFDGDPFGRDTLIGKRKKAKSETLLQ
ncbi:hypothetical protein V9N52_004189 [Vibrio navarrensis]